MSELAHEWGSDLQLSASGDLLIANEHDYTQQRLIRRLMTAAGDYVQQPTYGAGVGSYVGLPVNVGMIAGAIKNQMKREAAILQNPPPSVTVTTDNAGGVVATIAYTDTISGQASTLTFPIAGP